ncbi:MAG: hypothetical protein ACFFD4_14160 [Candidatus Odinarchaeota archaeon]
MFSIGTVILFSAVAITAVYLSFLSHKNNVLFRSKIKDLQESIDARKGDGKHIAFTISQSWLMKQVIADEKKEKDTLRGFFLTGKGGTIMLILVFLSSGVGLFLGLGLAFFNSDTGVTIAAIPIVIIVTYAFLVLLSEILATLKFTSEMRTVPVDKLGEKDLKVFIRASYILTTRRKQFLVIATLLFLYGLFGGFFDLLVIAVLTVVQVLFITILGNPALKDFIILVFLVAAFLSVFVSIIIVYIYVKFCMFLIKIKMPEDIAPAKISDST